MKRVLIVSPSFPPISAADIHRVRTSLPHYRDFGWDPVVLSVDPAAHGGLRESELLATVPSDIRVVRCGAVPESIARWAGVRTPGLRALPSLYRAGSEIIPRESIDLVYFSTTMFPVVTLGRLWKQRFRTPFVVDFQDPWKTAYRGRGVRTGIKARLARWLNGWTEPFAMRAADGVTTVSSEYANTLQHRYRNIRPDMCATIPFGASRADFAAAAAASSTGPAFFEPRPGRLNGVSVGRGGRDLEPAATILFEALKRVGGSPDIALTFIGTDYARDNGRQSIAPLAAKAGVADRVREFPQRVPYLQSLRVLVDADFTVILGSDDPAYSPSKVYPYLLTGRPFVAILHAASPVVSLLQQAGTGVVVTFRQSSETQTAIDSLTSALSRMPERIAHPVSVPAALVASIDARAMTALQCAAFDAALRQTEPEGVPCAE